MTWVVYNISKNRTRSKIARRCLDFRLYRVPKSVFLGDVDANRIDEIILAGELAQPARDAATCKSSWLQLVFAVSEKWNQIV